LVEKKLTKLRNVAFLMKKSSQFWTKFGRKMAQVMAEKLSHSFAFIGNIIILVLLGEKNGCLKFVLVA